MSSIPIKVKDYFFTTLFLPVIACTQLQTHWVPGSIPSKVKDYIFTTVFLPVMASTQLQTQWVPGSIPRLVKLLKNLPAEDEEKLDFYRHSSICHS